MDCVQIADQLDITVEPAALPAANLSRPQPSRYIGGLLASHPQRKQRQHFHHKPIASAWENSSLSALESSQRFSRALCGSDPEEARGRAYHASRRTGYLIEFALHRTWAHLCHGYACSRKVGA
jgi:hypothetical protein